MSFLTLVSPRLQVWGLLQRVLARRRIALEIAVRMCALVIGTLPLPCAVEGQSQPGLGSAAEAGTGRWTLTGYYSPVVDHRLGIWRHGLSAAVEYERAGFSIGPRFTIAHKDGGTWYGNVLFGGAHVSRHFHLFHSKIMPHVHMEMGAINENFIILKEQHTGFYGGIGGSVGWRIGVSVIIQTPQYTRVWTTLGKQYDVASVGVSVRL